MDKKLIDLAAPQDEWDKKTHFCFEKPGLRFLIWLFYPYPTQILKIIRRGDDTNDKGNEPVACGPQRIGQHVGLVLETRVEPGNQTITKGIK